MPALAVSASVAALCLGALPARAADFFDLSTWTNATTCDFSNSIATGCVDPTAPTVFDVYGPENTPGSYQIISPSFSPTTAAYVGFDYIFDPAGVASASYSTDGFNFVDLTTAATSTSLASILLDAGETFSFRVTNAGDWPILTISNFSAVAVPGPAPTAVPGPLPLLGVVIAFGWIRRLRARSRGI